MIRVEFLPPISAGRLQWSHAPAVFAGTPTLVATRNVLANEDRCDSKTAVIFFIPDGPATSSFFFIIPQSDPPPMQCASGDAS